MVNDDNNKNDKQSKDDNFDPTRRRFLKNTGFAVGGIAGGSLLGGYFTDQLFSGDEDSKNKKSKDDYTEARMFFSRDIDFSVLSAATERIFPEDDNGPGAIELRAPYYIDKQMAGQWGMNAKEYTQGPFSPDASSKQGYQSSMVRSEIFIQGVRRINEVSKEKFNEDFHELKEEQQDEVLTDFENDEVKMHGISSSMFFSMLRDTTIDGVYSDPVYGGNKNMDGWRMKEFPGAIPAYIDKIDSEEFEKMEPISLHDQHN